MAARDFLLCAYYPNLLTLFLTGSTIFTEEKKAISMEGMSMNLAEEVAKALGGVIPQDCPIKDKPSEAAKTRVLPDQAKKLVPLWHQQQAKCIKLINNGTGNDGGVWFRHHNETEAIMALIHNIIREERGLSYRFHFDLFTEWQYTEAGA